MSRTVKIYREVIGAPYTSNGAEVKDVIVAEVSHEKRRGHSLSVRVQTEGDRCIMFMLFTGIRFGHALDTRARFNRNALNKVAEATRADTILVTLLDKARAELATRKAEGKPY